MFDKIRLNILSAVDTDLDGRLQINNGGIYAYLKGTFI